VTWIVLMRADFQRSMRHIAAPACLLAFCAIAQETTTSLEFHRLPAETLERRLAGAAKTNAERATAVRFLLEEAGCAGERLREEAVRGSRLPNVICTLPGESGDSILVGAHFDKTDAGDGVVDNWSGASMLSSLYESLARVPRRHTFLFIAFTDEEKGLVGSQGYVKLRKNEVARWRAMINLDSLGMDSTKVGVSTSHRALVASAIAVARSFPLPIDAVNFDLVGRSDSMPFREKNIPVIDFHSITQKTWQILHSPRDRADAIDPRHYYETYRLLAAYLALLDLKLPDLLPSGK
ncbi:MAG: M28 family metallopeptidase, partial [Bryobacteraceae bacterium]